MRQVPLRMFKSILFTPAHYYNGTPCWVWTGDTQRGGYGRVWFDGGTKLTHRVIYELLLGPIPKGLCIDHLCRNRVCCNPGHMEVVTYSENVCRGVGPMLAKERCKQQTHCVHGHLYDEKNTRLSTNKLGEVQRICRTCHKEKSKYWAARKRRAEGKPIRRRGK